MKKRILAIVSAAVLALGCFATASAFDGSETAAGKKATKWIEKDGVLTLTGVDWEANTDDFQVKELNTFFDGDDDAAAKALMHLAAQFPKAKVIRAFNLTADDADTDSPVDITVADTKIKGTKKYTVYHLKNKVGEWETASIKNVTVKDGLIKFQVTDASPFAIAETSTGAGNTASSAAAGAGAAATGKTAAKTGEV